MKKLEASTVTGLQVVDQFSPETKILPGGVLEVEDFINALSRPFDGTIGWEATNEDIAKIIDADYTITGL